MVVLAPAHAVIPPAMDNITFAPRLHAAALREMQKMRGAIYLHEGNVTRDQLSRDRRHCTPEDNRAWHLLMRGRRGGFDACVLYLEHEPDVTLEDLRIRHCPLASDSQWGPRLRRAVRSEIVRAQEEGLAYSEIGGLAIQPERRGTPDGVLLTLATYALGRLRGGALGVTTANVAHSCASFLRRLGGAALESDGFSIPSYFDQRYNTEIELLRFDSRTPGTKYAALIDVIMEQFADVPVLAPTLPAAQPSRIYTPAATLLQPVFAA
jgi:hypothetical protein